MSIVRSTGYPVSYIAERAPYLQPLGSMVRPDTPGPQTTADAVYLQPVGASGVGVQAERVHEEVQKEANSPLSQVHSSNDAISKDAAMKSSSRSLQYVAANDVVSRDMRSRTDPQASAVIGAYMGVLRLDSPAAVGSGADLRI